MERRQLALMFTDIVGYSRLMGQNETQTIEMLGEYRQILLAQIEQHRGAVIEFIGDAVFARFDNPEAAVSAGINIQKDLSAFNQNSDARLPRLQSRIGIHMGEVTLKDDALFGDDVNIAARLEPIAVADGLCVSEDVYRAVKEDLKEPVLALGVQPLKNIDSRIRCYLIRPGGITIRTHTHYFLRKFYQKVEAYRYPLVACFLALIASGIYFVPRWLVPGYTANYVEIADFKNLMSEEGDVDYFSAGITEALRSQLADIHKVYILAADKGVRGPIRLEGSVQMVGDRLRIAYQLIRRKDQVQIAGGKLDAAYKDIFMLQDRVVAEIAGYLAKEFGLENFRPATPKLTSDITAYDYYLQGAEYLRKPKSHENFDAAIKLLSTALVHDANFARANAGLCQSYWEKFKLTNASDWAKRAEEYCQTALAQDDSASDIYQSLGIIYRDTGREEEAIEILEKSIAIDKTNVDAVIELANVYRVQNKLDLAEKTFQRAILEQPGYWEGYQELASFYLLKGMLQDAVKNYKKVLEITPDNIFAYSNLGGTYFYLAKYKKAAQALEKSVNLSPTWSAYSNTGTVYYFAGDYEKAEKMFREAIRLAPEDFRLYVNLADTLRQIHGHTDEVSELYSKTIQLALSGLELNKKNSQLHQYLAISYLFTDEQEKAEKFLRTALELSPENVDTIYTEVKFWSSIGKIENALKALAKLMKTGYSKDLLKVDPDLRILHKHPQYKEILAAP